MAENSSMSSSSDEDLRKANGGFFREFPLAYQTPSRPRSTAYDAAALERQQSIRGEADSDDTVVAIGGVDVEALEKARTADSAAPGGAMHPDSYPDGGAEAWLVVVGGFCCLFVSFGWINAIGIFEQVYQTSILSSYPPSTVAWIVSLETFIMFFFGPVMGVLFDNYGPRPLLLTGTFLHVFGLMMASISSEYWHFLLTQGVCSPLGTSAIFYAAMSSVVTWFHKRRGFALGVMASGSSFGGIVFPVMVQQIIPRLGFPWAMRIAAFTILGLLSVAILTVKTRLPPKPRRFSFMVFVDPLRQRNFVLLTLASLLIFFGLYNPFTFLPLQALQVGTNTTLDQYIIPIVNAASIFGRITPGYFSDKWGRYNTTIVMCMLCGILVLALWLPAQSPAPVIVFGALYGFASGAFVSVVPALVATVTPDMRRIGTNNGTLFAIISIGALCGNPIAGALIDEDHGHYLKLQIYCGCFLIAGSIMMVVTRCSIVKGKIWTKI